MKHRKGQKHHGKKLSKTAIDKIIRSAAKGMKAAIHKAMRK